MTLPDTASVIYCQKCGAAWDRSLDSEMEMFTPLRSPALLTAAGELMTGCPKDPITPGSGPDEGEVDEQRRRVGEGEGYSDQAPGTYVYPEDTPL